MNSAVDSSVSALLIGEYGHERLLVHDIFQKSGWRLFEARDRRQALRCLEQNPVQVVVAKADVPRWNWKDILTTLRSRQTPPQLIVTSRTADDYLWAEALNVGAYDVLAQPFDPDEVVRVIASARRHFDFRPERARPAAAVSQVA